ncbi:MAG: CPBP family intramembrane metalloprotease [Opitutaceae bacterium]|nr:CPBP family intramembrane metalloprotease [Opitutaceae bacterium]
MNASAASVFQALQLALLAAGVVLLWRLALSPQARSAAAPVLLPSWDVGPTNFLLFGISAFLGYFAGGAIAHQFSAGYGLGEDASKVFIGAAAQLGMLAGALLAPVDRGRIAGPLPAGRVAISGAAAFLAGFPVVLGVSLVAEWLVRRAGLPEARQDLIGMFARAESPELLAAMIALAVVAAPVAEELAFRVGLFRWLRTRIPRWAALALPALLFASLHVNWKTLAGLASVPPLVALAVVFSLAYERTGHVGTPIVAHALFNLNTVVGILTGAVKEP